MIATIAHKVAHKNGRNQIPTPKVTINKKIFTQKGDLLINFSFFIIFSSPKSSHFSLLNWI